jgi:hypothetical protein
VQQGQWDWLSVSVRLPVSCRRYTRLRCQCHSLVLFTVPNTLNGLRSVRFCFNGFGEIAEVMPESAKKKYQ